MKLSCHREYNILRGQLCEENKVGFCYDLGPSCGDNGRSTVLPENLGWSPRLTLVSFLSFSVELYIPWSQNGSHWGIIVAYLGSLYLENINYLGSRSNSFSAFGRWIYVLNIEWVKYCHASSVPRVCLMYIGALRSSQFLMWFQHHCLT